MWNGNWGRVYFYQSELPYDPPSQGAWSEAPGVNGYASYKVANTVTSHQAYGLGIYAVFINSVNISCFNAIETPTNQQVNVHDMMDVYIAGNTSGSGTSQINHIINGTGSAVGPSLRDGLRKLSVAEPGIFHQRGSGSYRDEHRRFIPQRVLAFVSTAI